jgi:nucleotide-binding universal stress UspA family protein
MSILRNPPEPPHPSTFEIGRVLLASEGRPFPEEAIRFASSLRAPVHVFSVARVYGVSFAFPNPWLRPSRREWQEQRDNVKRAIKELKRQGVEAEGHVVGTRKATRGILREAERQSCDVIVMAADAPRNRLVADMMWSQEPYRVRRRAKIPVYLVVEPNESQ